MSSAPTSVCSCLEGQPCGISPTMTAHHLCLPSKCSPTPHLPKASSCGPGGGAPDELHRGWQVPGLSHYPEHPPISPPSCKELLGGCTASPQHPGLYTTSVVQKLVCPIAGSNPLPKPRRVLWTLRTAMPWLFPAEVAKSSHLWPPLWSAATPARQACRTLPVFQLHRPVWPFLNLPARGTHLRRPHCSCPR